MFEWNYIYYSRHYISIWSGPVFFWRINLMLEAYWMGKWAQQLSIILWLAWGYERLQKRYFIKRLALKLSIYMLEGWLTHISSPEPTHTIKYFSQVTQFPFLEHPLINRTVHELGLSLKDFDVGYGYHPDSLIYIRGQHLRYKDIGNVTVPYNLGDHMHTSFSQLLWYVICYKIWLFLTH